MRASEETNELIKYIKSKDFEKMVGPRWDEYKINDFCKIKSILALPDYFLGVREDSINIYYKGMSMAKVQAYYHRACKYTTSYYYAEENLEKRQKDEQKQYILSPVMFWSEKYQNRIKERIKKHVYGYHDGKMRLEKVCQQWIMNKNNSNPNSEWYYVDMEYIYKKKGELGNHPFGRADLIAIKRKPNANNKHDVAFVELKVGVDAYKGKPDKLMKAIENID